MNTWVTDNIPMTGGAFRQLVLRFLREQPPDEWDWVLREKRGSEPLKANLLNVIARTTTLLRPVSRKGVQDRISSQDKEVFRVRGGHIGIMAGMMQPKTPGRTLMPGWMPGQEDRKNYEYSRLNRHCDGSGQRNRLCGFCRTRPEGRENGGYGRHGRPRLETAKCVRIAGKTAVETFVGNTTDAKFREASSIRCVKSMALPTSASRPRASLATRWP